MDTQEEAKAVREMAKTCGKGIDAIQSLGRFVSRFVEAPLEQGLGIVSDKLAYMRWERQARYMGRVTEVMHELGMEAPNRPVPMKIAIPIFQAACLEEDDSLQELWVNLLVNAANAESRVSVHHAHISILKDFGPLEAVILDKICTIPNLDLSHGVWTRGLPDRIHFEKPDDADSQVGQGNARPNKNVQLAIQNLFRLGCLLSLMAFPDGANAYSCVCPTPLGYALHNACTLRHTS